MQVLERTCYPSTDQIQLLPSQTSSLKHEFEQRNTKQNYNNTLSSPQASGFFPITKIPNSDLLLTTSPL